MNNPKVHTKLYKECPTKHYPPCRSPNSQQLINSSTPLNILTQNVGGMAGEMQKGGGPKTAIIKQYLTRQKIGRAHV